ncbi:MAG: sugar transferase [Chloroflexota bacterium]|nr:sugar transferase [Chloroflexota bacterium]
MAVENEQHSFPSGARGSANPGGGIARSTLFASPDQRNSFYIAYGKRMLDVTLAGLLLLLTAPLLVVIAVLVVLDSPGPALFVQERVGKDGTVFWMFKFRTMHAANDPLIHEQHVQRMIRENTEPQPGGSLKMAADPRVTRLGRRLRRSSLDELPQLLNVLRGEMSLVGPRPDLPYAVAVYKPWYHERFSAMPGVTGYWQVVARNTVSYERMIQMDIDYARRQSFGWDLLLLLQTTGAVIRGKGAS